MTVTKQITQAKRVTMIELIIHILLLGGVIFFVAESLPGVYVDGYGTALIVAVVYGLINVFLGTFLMLITFPLMIITIGLFKLVINTFLLWLTDQMLEDFEIKDLGTTIIITCADTFLSVIL